MTLLENSGLVVDLYSRSWKCDSRVKTIIRPQEIVRTLKVQIASQTYGILLRFYRK